jgi:hypothetical protein
MQGFAHCMISQKSQGDFSEKQTDKIWSFVHKHFKKNMAGNLIS